MILLSYTAIKFKGPLLPNAHFFSKLSFQLLESLITYIFFKLSWRIVRNGASLTLYIYIITFFPPNLYCDLLYSLLCTKIKSNWWQLNSYKSLNSSNKYQITNFFFSLCLLQFNIFHLQTFFKKFSSFKHENILFFFVQNYFFRFLEDINTKNSHSIIYFEKRSF